SLLFFIGILSAAFNVIGLFIFVLFLENLLTVNPFYFGFTHIVTGFLANLSVFLIVACLRSVFTLFSRNRLLRKLAGTIQPVLLMGFVSVLVWFQYIYPQMAELRAGGSSFMLWFPSMWFNGLYETMLGAGGELVTRQFYMALAALLLPLTIYLAGFPITFKRFITQTNSVRKKVTFAKLRGFYRKILHAVFLRNPLQRGVFYFMLHTLKRSRKHKLQMAIYMALPVSYILTQLVYRYMSEGVVCFNKQDGFLVSVSLIFYFFLAVAIWMTVRHPADIKANWIFKLTESADKHHYLSGLQKALIFFLGGPAVLVLFIFYSLCWGVLPALYHSLYSLVIFIMLLELFFMNHNKIPLAAVCDPGKPNIKRNWPLYIAGFLQYIVTFSFLGEVMLAEPSNYIPFFISIFSLIGALILRRRRNYKEIGYRFIYDEDEPEEVMLSLNLG
ncbi:MAG: hypothetical protein GY765_31975, partial [bacterium]|nr:hypothetical protein [bacterium]